MGTLMLVVLAAAMLGGCSAQTYSKISREQLQQKVSSLLEKQVGQRPDKIECPGDLDAKTGATTRCVLTAGGTRLGTTVRVTSATEDGNYKLDIQVDKQPMR